MNRKTCVKPIQVNSEKLTEFQWHTMEIVVGSNNNRTSNKMQDSTNCLNNIFKRCEDELKSRYKLLAVIVLILLISNITVLVVILQCSKQNSDICLNSPCIQTAAKSLQYLNRTIDPCNNFYDFVCGNFGKDVNNCKPVTNVVDDGNSFVEHQIESLLREPILYEDSKPIKFLKNVYSVCSDLHKSTEKMDTLFLSNLLYCLQDWPTIKGNNWNETNFNWMEFIYESRKFGIPHDYFFKIQVIANNNNNITYYHLSITPIEEKIYDDLFIKTVAKALGGNEAIIEKDFNNVILFKTEFHKKMFNQIKTNKKATITIKELQTKYPIINWLLFLNKLINLPELTITENKLITLNVEDFGDLLKLILHTPKRILSNYMITRTMQYIITYLPALYNSTFKQNLKINSVQVAIESLPLAINVWYVKKYFTSITKNQVKEILTNIKNKFKDTLENTKLFDKPTKNCAINKLNAMTADIGYSEEMFNDSLIKSYYNKLQISFGYCLDAVLSANKFKIDTNFRKLDLSLSADWTNTGIDVTKMNVYYNLETNHIVIPAAFILYTSHNQNGLNYLNYATLGFTIGQQITNGFVRGKYGLNGTLNQCWSPEITKTFEEKNQCFIDQYKNFTMFNTPINSNFTLLDNIADNNGLRLAYNTYQALKSKNTEQKLPGLNFNENQMFWISYAQAQCERMTESYFIQHAQYESRVPQACRITETLSNMENFAKDFNCKVNAPMNPIKKCTVW